MSTKDARRNRDRVLGAQALIKHIESFSDIALSSGTLYGALAKLEADAIPGETMV